MIRRALALAATTIALSASRDAHALEQSTRGPFYAQAVVGGVSAWVDFPTAYYRTDAEFGFHFSGRADGFVLGVRQAFDIGRFSIGETVLRFGYDIAIPIENGRYEISLAPYGTFGLNYIFQGLSAGLPWSVGFEGRFFVWRGLYAFLRPIELMTSSTATLA